MRYRFLVNKVHPEVKLNEAGDDVALSTGGAYSARGLWVIEETSFLDNQ